jgi:hypothetical protein
VALQIGADAAMTKRLIITNNDSASGHLKVAHRGAVTIPLGRTLIWGRLMTDAELAVFFAPRRESKTKTKTETETETKLETEIGTEFHWLGHARRWRDETFESLVEMCTWADSVELWIDPRPNDQVQLICLLHYLRAYPDIAAKLLFIQSYTSMGGHLPKVHAKWRLPVVKISEDHFELASRAWRALGTKTPQAWFDLLATDLSLLPRLRNAVIQLLEELPWRATGLGATQMRMLEFISGDGTTPIDVLRYETNDSGRIFDYWEMGALLDGLARCRTPAVSGLKEGPFTMKLHDNRERHKRYNESKLLLTAFGNRILTHTDDFARHNTIRRWWGGTKLTNKNLWRWDQDNHVLIAP